MATHDFQQRTGFSCISEEEFQKIVKGDVITYLLTSEMQPTNPLRKWHGRVEKHDRAGWVEITLLDEGYAGETEIVWRTEILAVTKHGTERDYI
jgi:hypothetical protein